MENFPTKHSEVGFTRKRDGKIVNIKLIDIIKKLSFIDFVNNEVSINGETLVADSFRKPYYEASLKIITSAGEGAAGTVSVNGANFEPETTSVFEKGCVVVIGATTDENSVVDTITDSTGQSYELTEGQLSITLTADTSLTISFKAKVVE